MRIGINHQMYPDLQLRFSNLILDSPDISKKKTSLLRNKDYLTGSQFQLRRKLNAAQNFKFNFYT